MRLDRMRLGNPCIPSLLEVGPSLRRPSCESAAKRAPPVVHHAGRGSRTASHLPLARNRTWQAAAQIRSLAHILRDKFRNSTVEAGADIPGEHSLQGRASWRQWLARLSRHLRLKFRRQSSTQLFAYPLRESLRTLSLLERRGTDQSTLHECERPPLTLGRSRPHHYLPGIEHSFQGRALDRTL